MAITNKDIMIVDDDVEIRILMKKMLEVVGANVIEHDCVESALEYALKSPPHLVLLDLKMPKHSGFQFLKARTKSTLLGKVPVVVVSGSRDKDSIYKAISLGAADFVVKPLNTKIILQKVRKYLKDNSFFSYEFPKEERPEAGIKMSGQVVSLNKGHFKLEAPVKLQANSPMDVKAQLLSTLKCGETPLRTSKNQALYVEDQRYQNTIEFIGPSPEAVKKIQETIKKLA